MHETNKKIDVAGARDPQLELSDYELQEWVTRLAEATRSVK